jgi:hypothetical protein
MMGAAVVLLAGNGRTAPLPFGPGERLTYEIRWQQFRAGTACMAVLPLLCRAGEETLHFQLTARTTPFIDLFFKVRECIEGFIPIDFSGSLLYTRYARGKEKKEIQVNFFDWTAVYTNFGKSRDPIEIPPGTLDPVSAFYWMRTCRFALGKTFAFPVTDGKKWFLQKGRVLKREQLDLAGTSFDTVVLALFATHFSGIFKKSPQARIRVWITDDARKIPVRIQVRVIIGSIYFDLASTP